MIDKYYWKVVWFFTGVFFAIAGSLMLISGTFCLDCFYNVGKVYDMVHSSLIENWNDTLYFDNIKQIFVVDSEVAVKNFGLSDKKGGWKYMYISFSDVSKEAIDARIDFYGSGDILVDQMSARFREGGNLIEIPVEQFDRMDLVMENQKDLSFRIDKLQFRETEPVFSASEFVKYVLLLLMVFLCVTGFFGSIIKKRKIQISWYAPVQGLQEIFRYVGKKGEYINQRFSLKHKGFIRSGLFCFIFLLMQVGLVSGIYNSDIGYRNLVYLCVAALLGIGLLCWEKNLRCLNWNNKLVVSWLCLWIISMFSDFIVEKRYSYIGYIMVFVIGFLFFMWGNMEHREWLIQDFIRGIQWSFIPNILFCWLFRPYIPGYRYTGGTHTPGFFAMYLLFVWMAFLADIEFKFKDKKILYKDCICIFFLGICGDFLWKTQSISSIIPAALVVFVFSLRFWFIRKKVRIWEIPVFLVVFVISFSLNGSCVYHLPRLLHTEIKFENDFYMDTVTEHPFTLTVKAAEEGNENRLLYKLKTSSSLETLTTGRTLYWKGHLRELNLWGHRNKIYLLGDYRFPHNGLIAIMFRYGIFAAVPYVLMLMLNLWFALRYFWRHMGDRPQYAFFVLCDMLSCTFLILVENLEIPLILVCWYGMYLIMGAYFDDESSLEHRQAKD